jgi:RIO kinase 1
LTRINFVRTFDQAAIFETIDADQGLEDEGLPDQDLADEGPADEAGADEGLAAHSDQAGLEESWFEQPTSRRAARLLGAPAPTRRKKRPPKRSEHALLDEIVAHSDSGQVDLGDIFRPTFSGSRHEREWILNYLGPFYDTKKITDVLRRVKGGKEANVYCCAAHPNTGLALLAAKVYRPRMFRNLRNDAQYRQGRSILDENGKEVRDERYLLAVRKGTTRGKEFQHVSWLEHEFVTMQLLHAAGADVPLPLVSGSNTILMEYLGTPEAAAAALNEVSLPRARARPMFDRLIWNVELMLANRRIHGDLSAYNVLYWDGQFKIIDFPQAIDPWVNPDARAILGRDVQRLCQYFTRYKVRANPQAIAADLWARYGPPEEEYVPEESTFEELT